MVCKEGFIAILIFSVTLFLTNCGGGGNGGTTSPLPPSDPLDNWHLRLDNVPCPYACVNAYGKGLFVNPFSASTYGIDWTIGTSEVSKHLSSVAYGNNIFVAVGAEGTVATSIDGINWTKRDSGISETLDGVAFVNGTFVAFGSGGTSLFPKNIIISSTNGLNWTYLEIDYRILSIAYGYSIYVAVCENGFILTSPDLFSWTLRDSGTSYDLNKIIYANDIFVAVGELGTIVTSKDGINFNYTDRSKGPYISPFSESFVDIVYGNSIFVVARFNQGWRWSCSGDILISPDGINWEETSALGFCPSRIFYGNGIFFVNGPYNLQLVDLYHTSTSVDGINWTEETTCYENASSTGITYINNNFIVTGSSPLVSPDGGTWTIAYSPQYVNMPDEIDFGKGIFVGLRDGTIVTSEDGMNWTLRDSRSFNKVLYGNNIFVAVGAEGTIVTSTDGINWTTRNSDSRYSLDGVTFGNDTFVAVGTSGALLTSKDGELWTLKDIGTECYFYAVYFISGNFIAYGNCTPINSSDGNTWNDGNLGLPDYVNEIAYGKGYYVAATTIGVFVSTDGVNWTVKDLGTEYTRDYYDVVFGNNTFIVLQKRYDSDFAIYQSDPL